jgi:hypothetical protein
MSRTAGHPETLARPARRFAPDFGRVPDLELLTY